MILWSIVWLFNNVSEPPKTSVIQNTKFVDSEEIQIETTLKDKILSALADVSINEKYLLSWYVDEVACVNDDCTQIRFWLTELPDWYKEFSTSESSRLIASIILYAVAGETENKNTLQVSIYISSKITIRCTKWAGAEIKCNDNL
jgi:hypothetical protein